MKWRLLYILLIALTTLKCGVMMIASGYDLLQPIPANLRLVCEYAAFATLLFCPMLLGRRWRWTYVIILLLDLWIWSNLVYFRAYGDFLHRWLLPNLTSMHGVWGSIWTYSSWADLLLPILTASWIALSECCIRKGEMRATRFDIVGTLVGIVLLMMPTLLISRKSEMNFCGFDFSYSDRNMSRRWYVLTYGPIMHFFNEAAAWALCHEQFPQPVAAEELLPYMSPKEQPAIADSMNVLLILFESLEYWTVDTANAADDVAPCMRRMIRNGAQLHCVTHQVADGRSADAQMLILCGLMPIVSGATCMRYPGNCYPSLVKDYGGRHSYMLAANRPATWNQDLMCTAYGFNGLFAEETTDSIIMERTWEHIQNAVQPWWVVPITMASHPPYTQCGTYEASVCYTDRQIGRLIRRIEDNLELREHTLILITGDHCRYEGGAEVPLIIIDPQHTELNQPITDQVDIYRWLRKRLAIRTPWLGTKDRHLSDRIIRTNYFDKRL